MFRVRRTSHLFSPSAHKMLRPRTTRGSTPVSLSYVVVASLAYTFSINSCRNQSASVGDERTRFLFSTIRMPKCRWHLPYGEQCIRGGWIHMEEQCQWPSTAELLGFGWANFLVWYHIISYHTILNASRQRAKNSAGVAMSGERVP